MTFTVFKSFGFFCLFFLEYQGDQHSVHLFTFMHLAGIEEHKQFVNGIHSIIQCHLLHYGHALHTSCFLCLSLTISPLFLYSSVILSVHTNTIHLCTHSFPAWHGSSLGSFPALSPMQIPLPFHFSQSMLCVSGVMCLFLQCHWHGRTVSPLPTAVSCARPKESLSSWGVPS